MQLRLILLLALSCYSLMGCKDLFQNLKPFQIPGAGLNEHAGKLYWTMQIGIMTDAGFPAPNRQTLVDRLEMTGEGLAQLLPGLQLKFIIDQPMDAVFLLDHSVVGSEYAARYEPASKILLVDNPEHNRAILDSSALANSQRKRLQANLRAYAAALQAADLMPDANRLTGSVFLWQSYFKHQVRNDLIVLNTPLLEDRTKLYSNEKLPPVAMVDGLSVAALFAAPGRTAMERHGAVVYPDSTLQHWHKVELTLLSLIMARPACLQCEHATSCACTHNWAERLQYLKGLTKIRSAKLHEGCRLMEEYRAHSWSDKPARWEIRLCDRPQAK